MIRVLVVARIALVRAGLASLLASDRDLDVVQLPDGNEPIVERIGSVGADVLLVDDQVLEREGWTLLSELHGHLPGLHILVVGERPADRRALDIFSLGAQGYLLHDASAGEMTAAVRAANEGLYVLAAGVADNIAEQASASLPGLADRAPVGEDEADGQLVEPLSPRELEVLRLMARGLSNKQIAAQLFITEHTVKFHIRSILGKLGAGNRTEAVTLALQRGLVSL